MRLSYIQGLRNPIEFVLTPGGRHTLHIKSYKDVQVTGTVNVEVDGAGQADFTNDDECCCCKEEGAPQFYLQRLIKAK
jgi:hypothetical protein